MLSYHNYLHNEIQTENQKIEPIDYTSTREVVALPKEIYEIYA